MIESRETLQDRAKRLAVALPLSAPELYYRLARERLSGREYTDRDVSVSVSQCMALGRSPSDWSFLARGII